MKHSATKARTKTMINHMTSSEMNRRQKVDEYYLELCIKLTGRNLELFPHEDDSELAVIDGDTREVLFSSKQAVGWTGGITFVEAFHQWHEQQGLESKESGEF
jgi:hypothetical protein